MIRRAMLGLLAMLLAPVTAAAADRMFVNGEPVTLQPDQGYVLVRVHHISGGIGGTFLPEPILFRVLDDRALTGAQSDPEPNIAEAFADKPYLVLGDEEYLLTSVKPGTYVLGGMAVTSW